MRIFVADTETTGVGRSDKVVEVAWIEIDTQFNEVGRAHSRINPGVPIPPQASRVHGIYDADVEDAPTLDEFMAQYDLSGPAMFVAHNAKFDARFIGHYWPTDTHILCTLELARRLLPNAPDHKLGTLQRYLGLQAGSAHSADGDVFMLKQLLERLVTLAACPITELSKPLPLLEIMPFGKHKGTKIAKLPLDYVRWMASQEDFDRSVLTAAKVHFPTAFV